MLQSKETLTELLNRVKNKIPCHQKWTKGASFRDNKGKQIHNEEGMARMCILGAIGLTTKEMNISDCYMQILPIFRKTGLIFGHGFIGEYNDAKTTRHKDIIKLLDSAILEIKNEN